MSKAPLLLSRISAALLAFLLLIPAARAFPPGGARLSPLAAPPRWQSLDPYQRTVTRREFDARLQSLYATTPASAATFARYATEDDGRIVFFADDGKQTPRYTLFFAADEKDRVPLPVPGWRQNPDRPLVICLDPGHIGGPWAHMEERYMEMNDDPPVLEARLNLLACRRVEAALKKAGVRVAWTKTDEEPVTPLRPADLRGPALEALFENGHPLLLPPQPLLEQEVEVESQKLFYRTAEIQARARRVAELKPDLTLCVHFNAAAWGNPLRPDFVDKSRLVVFVHGQYEAVELVYEDERFDLIRKLLTGHAPMEEAIATAIAGNLEKTWPDYPPENYQDWAAVKRVGPNPAVYARNLLASRLFPGPVVFVEGPYMNARDAYPRIEAGDYEGVKVIAGKPERSIFAEYGEAIAAGALDYFEKNRKK